MPPSGSHACMTKATLLLFNEYLTTILLSLLTMCVKQILTIKKNKRKSKTLFKK